MAGRKINRAFDLAPADFVRDGGRGRRAFAEQDVNSALAQNFRGSESEFLAEESSIVAYQERWFRVAAEYVACNRRCGQADVCERKIFRDNRAPAGSPKLDRCAHFENRIIVAPAKYCSVARKNQIVQKYGKRERVTSREEILTDKFVVLVTCPNARQAGRIARAVVEARLAACVNILPGAVTSIYRWKGKIESAEEKLLLIKTSRKWLVKLRETVEKLHSYDVPEFIALPIAEGSPAYLAWLNECLEENRK